MPPALLDNNAADLLFPCVFGGPVHLLGCSFSHRDARLAIFGSFVHGFVHGFGLFVHGFVYGFGWLVCSLFCLSLRLVRSWFVDGFGAIGMLV